MPITVSQITVNRYLTLSGVLQVASDGSRGTGRRFTNYRVHIVKILDRNVPYPILLGDDHTDSLGWVSYDDLTGVTKVRVTSVTLA